ncbi:rhodanese-like domain-containing protein [Myroides indicus]|uniref:Rhodanese-related sulfurtransferase n=1 Tax=Myroides indicus TaxID=1323422 RepID=A0A4V3E9H8_9FLAO|nr:rhodanese-like domain-containing protein [Myroides indicus]TDS65035.1 rhodanese-related sulfurtransferase [Myroides indicus]
MKKLFLVILILITGINCRAQVSEEANLLEKKEFYKVISQTKKVQLVDVRTAEEYKNGTIKYAQNIDCLSDDFIENTDKLNKKEPVYIFCKSGNRSAKAKEKMIENGFEQVYELKDGYLAWKKENE